MLCLGGSYFQLHRSSRNGDVGRSVGRSVGPCHLAFQQHFVHVAALSSLVQSGLDQCRPIQSTLVKSSLLQSNLVKSSQIQKNLFQAISGSIYCMWRLFEVQFSLDQTSEDQFSLLQSKQVKSSQIQINLFQVISDDIFDCIKLFIGSLQSSLVKSSLFQSTIVNYS